MDVLSDVLRVVRLSGAVFFTARLSCPWSVASPPPDRLARTLRVEGGCIALFHVVVEGSCWITLEGHPRIEVGAGTVIILPHGDPHTMASGPGIEPRPISSLMPGFGEDGIPQIEYGGGGDVARFVCGYLHCDQQFNPLIGALPTLLVVDPGRARVVVVPWEGSIESSTGGQTATGDAWLKSTLDHVVAEAEGGHPGNSAMLARLTELMYLEVLRRYMRQLPIEHTGWLAGARHPEVGRALRLLHESPARKWTVEDLAFAAGLSRSALAQRFTDLIGQPPLHYLSGWRIQLAQNMLRQSSLSIAQVAERVGYESHVAFHRAFKRHTGEPPAEWRKRPPEAEGGSAQRSKISVGQD